MLQTDIISKDLNLLKIFDALLAERSVTKAAKRLRMTQPALSHALQRLREALGDEVFVRVPRGVEPTPRALALAPVVAEALARLQAVFAAPEAFDPATARGTLVFATTEYFEQLFLPAVVAAIAAAAPHVTIRTVSTAGILPKDALERGDYDVAAAGFFGDLPEGFYRKRLFDDGFACAVRKGHPALRQGLSLAVYLALGHVLISPHGDLFGTVDRALAARGETRRLVAGVASFLTPGWIVARTDLIVTAPRRLCQSFATYLPVELHEPPLALGGIAVMMVWHQRTHADPLRQWVRGLIEQACLAG